MDFVPPIIGIFQIVFGWAFFCGSIFVIMRWRHRLKNWTKTLGMVVDVQISQGCVNRMVLRATRCLSPKCVFSGPMELLSTRTTNLKQLEQLRSRRATSRLLRSAASGEGHVRAKRHTANNVDRLRLCWRMLCSFRHLLYVPGHYIQPLKVFPASGH